MSATRHTPGPWHHDWQFIVAPDPAGIHPDIYIAEIVETDHEGRMATRKQQEAKCEPDCRSPCPARSCIARHRAMEPR